MTRCIFTQSLSGVALALFLSACSEPAAPVPAPVTSEQQTSAAIKVKQMPAVKALDQARQVEAQLQQAADKRREQMKQQGL